MAPYTNQDASGICRGTGNMMDCDCPKFMGLLEEPKSANSSIPWMFCHYCGHPPTNHSRLKDLDEPSETSTAPETSTAHVSKSKVRHTCPVCSHSTNNIITLQIHLKKHSNKFFLVCPLCKTRHKGFHTYRQHFRKCNKKNAERMIPDSQSDINIEENVNFDNLPHCSNDDTYESVSNNYKSHLINMLIDMEVAHRSSQTCLDYLVGNLAHFSIPSMLLEKLDSKRKRIQCYSDLGIYVPPQKIFINEKACYFIPFGALLENLLKIPFYKYSFSKIWKCSHSKLSDYCCGIKFADILNSKNIVLSLYSDDIEIANPIGMKRGRKGKLTVFYVSFLNIPPEERSKLKNIFLLAIGESKVLKSNKERLELLQNFFSNLEKRYIEINGEKYNITLHSYIGDALAAHAVGGFKESFNPKIKFQCHKCLTPSENYHSTYRHSESNPKSSYIYHEQLQELMNCSPENFCLVSQNTGIKDKSIFHQIKYFSVIDGILLDVMHIFLEGIAPKEISLFIKYIISKKYMTRQTLNEKLKTFKFSSLIKSSDYPRTFDANLNVVTKSKNVIILLTHLPLILKSLLPNDKYLYCLIQLSVIVLICLSPSLFRESISEVENLIASHQKLYIKLYGVQNLIPKFHMAIHLPSQILKHGPLRHHWAMRFEGKNALPKSKTHFNFKDIAGSLSHFYQIGMTHSLWNGSGSPKETHKKSVCITMNGSNEIGDLMNANDSKVLCTSIIQDNVQYSKGDIVMANNTPNEAILKLFIIEEIYIMGDLPPEFIVNSLTNMQYDAKINAFVGTKSMVSEVIKFIALDSPLPVYSYAENGKLICIPQNLPFLPASVSLSLPFQS